MSICLSFAERHIGLPESWLLLISEPYQLRVKTTCTRLYFQDTWIEVWIFVVYRLIIDLYLMQCNGLIKYLFDVTRWTYTVLQTYISLEGDNLFALLSSFVWQSLYVNCTACSIWLKAGPVLEVLTSYIFLEKWNANLQTWRSERNFWRIFQVRAYIGNPKILMRMPLFSNKLITSSFRSKKIESQYTIYS